MSTLPNTWSSRRQLTSAFGDPPGELYIVFESGLFAPLCETWRHLQIRKHIMYCRQKRTELGPQVTNTEHLVKHGRGLLSYASGKTDRQTDIHSDGNTGFVQKLKCFFSRIFQDLQRPNSRVFQDSKILFSGLSRTRSIHKHGLHEVKKVHIQNQLSVYLHYSKESKMQYPRFYYFI